MLQKRRPKVHMLLSMPVDVVPTSAHAVLVELAFGASSLSSDTLNSLHSRVADTQT